jgi:oxygen-independent coproporphyrinogen-3 oxidase
VDEYLSAIESGNLPVKSSEALSGPEALDEELFLGLRQLEGIDFADIESRYGVSLRVRLKELAANGFIEIEGTRARLAGNKITVSNEVFVELMGQPAS